jgi:hypothetical protein
MNKSITDQIAQYIARYKVLNQNIYLSDEDMAKVFTELMITLLHTSMCENSTAGVCSLFWKHDDCYTLMRMSYRITLDEKYIPKWGSSS